MAKLNCKGKTTGISTIVLTHPGTDSKMGGASVISTKKASVISKQAHSTLGSKVGGPATISEHTGSQVRFSCYSDILFFKVHYFVEIIIFPLQAYTISMAGSE